MKRKNLTGYDMKREEREAIRRAQKAVKSLNTKKVSTREQIDTFMLIGLVPAIVMLLLYLFLVYLNKF